MPVGFVHALFEVAIDALKRVEDPTDGDAMAAAIAATDLDTVVGNIAWGKETCRRSQQERLQDAARRRPMAAKEDGSFDLVIVENANAPEIPTAGKMETLW